MSDKVIDKFFERKAKAERWGKYSENGNKQVSNDKNLLRHGKDLF